MAKKSRYHAESADVINFGDAERVRNRETVRSRTAA